MAANYVGKALVAGVLVVLPVYLAVLLLLKAAGSVLGLVSPIAELFPAWIPAAKLLSVVLVLVFCFLIGAVFLTSVGHALRRWLDQTVLERIPGYALFRSLGRRITNESAGTAQSEWKPALVEIEEALVPGFIVEEIDDDSVTVFVPSVPTPFAGAVYIIERRRVHPIDVPFTVAIKSISRWGSGAGVLVAAMRRAPPVHGAGQT